MYTHQFISKSLILLAIISSVLSCSSEDEEPLDEFILGNERSVDIFFDYSGQDLPLIFEGDRDGFNTKIYSQSIDLNNSGTNDITLAYSNGQKSNGEKKIEVYFESVSNGSQFLYNIIPQNVGVRFELAVESVGRTIDPAVGDYVSIVNRMRFAYDINEANIMATLNPFTGTSGYVVFKSISEDNRPIIGWIHIELASNNLMPNLLDVGIKYLD